MGAITVFEKKSDIFSLNINRIPSAAVERTRNSGIKTVVERPIRGIVITE
jgi:hypothetical protein